jgi:hypothetical protein
MTAEESNVKPKTKILALIFGLVLPYIALVMYFALRIQEHPLPTWFPYFGLSYILATMIVVMVFSRKVYRGTQPEGVEKPKSVWLWLGRAWMSYLVAIWSGGFLWGAYLTFKGNLEWQRSVPAGAFLLAFIALFSWALYKDFKRIRKPTRSAGETGTNNS